MGLLTPSSDFDPSSYAGVVTLEDASKEGTQEPTFGLKPSEVNTLQSAVLYSLAQLAGGLGRQVFQGDEDNDVLIGAESNGLCYVSGGGSTIQTITLPAPTTELTGVHFFVYAYSGGVEIAPGDPGEDPPWYIKNPRSNRSSFTAIRPADGSFCIFCDGTSWVLLTANGAYDYDWDGDSYSIPGAFIADPSGGATVDAEARAAIVSINQLLRNMLAQQED